MNLDFIEARIWADNRVDPISALASVLGIAVRHGKSTDANGRARKAARAAKPVRV